MDLASKKNAADVPPPPEGSAERQSSNNYTSCDIIPGRDVNMALLAPRASKKAVIRETGFATKCSGGLLDTSGSLF